MPTLSAVLLLTTAIIAMALPLMTLRIRRPVPVRSKSQSH